MIVIHPDARVSALADIEDSVRGTRIEVGARSVIDSFVKIKPAGGNGDLVIGERTVINSGCVLYTGQGLRIGNDVARRGIDVRADVDILVEALFGRRRQRQLERADDDIFLDVLLARQRIGHVLVGIDLDDPVAAAGLDTAVAARAFDLPGAFDDARAGISRDLGRAVSGTIEHDDDLVGEGAVLFDWAATKPPLLPPCRPICAGVLRPRAAKSCTTASKSSTLLCLFTMLVNQLHSKRRSKCSN